MAPNHPPARPLYITFTAGVDQTSTDRLITAVTSAFNEGTREIHLMISTVGGGIMNGITIFNFLRQLPIQLTTHNIGNVDSVGNVIFLAGARRIATPQSTFMFHGVSFNTNGPSQLSEQILMDYLALVRADQARMANVIVERTQVPREAAERMFSRAETKTSQEALAAGIVHEVTDHAVPQNAIVVLISAPLQK